MKYKSKHFSSFFRVATLLIFLILIGSVLLTWWKGSINSVDSDDKTPVTFEIPSGQTVRTIAQELKTKDLIRSPMAFFLYVKMNGFEKQLQAGNFRLNKSMTLAEITKELTHGIVDVWVTTLEGWRVEEVANRLAKDLGIPETEFLKVAKEGYMFPDTYLIPREASAGAIASQLLSTFESKITPAMKRDLQTRNLSMDEAVILASLVEREGKTNRDRPIIAGILLNRLKIGMPLQVDATLQYALGYQSQEKSWWKKNLTNEDKKIDSPFNTYVNTGLPPAPIANPGIEAITAVIYPATSSYLYYIHDPAGEVHFASTLEEHNSNVRKYLQ